MANYNSNLKTWGATGSEYPDGYSYEAGDQPVDAWDNYVNSNLVNDIQHLIALTNDRIETDSGTSGNEPASPENGHFYYDTTNERLKVWDSTAASWVTFLDRGGDSMNGVLDMSGYQIEDSGGNLTLASTVNVTGTLKESGNNVATETWVNNNADVPNANYADSAGDANTLDGNDSSYFATSGHAHSLGDLSNVSASGEGTGNNFDADTVDGDHASAFASSGHSHALGDLSNVSATGEGSGNGFDADMLDGNHASYFTTLTEVNNNADVPNADYADTAGDADTLNGKTSSEIGSSVEFGDGSDGSVTWTGGETVSGIYNFTDLVVEAGATVNIDGIALVRASESITLDGTLRATYLQGGAGGPAVETQSSSKDQSGGPGVSGQYGNGGNGSDGQGIDSTPSGGVGGSGGDGKFSAEFGQFFGDSTSVAPAFLQPSIGSSGGGGGGGARQGTSTGYWSAPGEDGGDGGGIVIIYTPSLTGSGTVDVSGQDGQDGGDATDDFAYGGGAGGGGSGGLAYIYADQDPVTVDVSAGVGGVGGSSAYYGGKAAYGEDGDVGYYGFTGI
jgi:hypothetical protein